MTTREAVYYCIDTERDYQDLLWNVTTTTTKGMHSVAEWLVYIEDYLNEAKHLLSRGAEQDIASRALDNMRKIAAMAVACMEQNGCSIREKPDPRKIMEEHGISIEVP